MGACPITLLPFSFPNNLYKTNLVNKNLLTFNSLLLTSNERSNGKKE
jgi:hypothetical protein